jgi:hypothetical protein
VREGPQVQLETGVVGERPLARGLLFHVRRVFQNS